MPLYEYLCPRCGRFELIRKFSDAPLLTCPTCGGEIQKMLSAPAIQFKGTGWYVTDYARKSGGGSDGGKRGESKSGDGGSTASGSKEGSSSSADTGSKSETGSKAAASGSGSKGSGGGGSSTT